MTELRPPGSESSVMAMLRRELAEARADLDEAGERVRLLEIALRSVSSAVAGPGSSRQPETPPRPEGLPRVSREPEGRPGLGGFQDLGGFRSGSSPANGVASASGTAGEGARSAGEGAGTRMAAELHAPIGGRAGEPPMRGAVYVDRAPASGEGTRQRVWRSDQEAAASGWSSGAPRGPGLVPGAEGDRRRSSEMPGDEHAASFELRGPDRRPYESGIRPEGEPRSGVGHDDGGPHDGGIS